MIKIAINGFGRIGRPSFKIAFEKEDVEIVRMMMKNKMLVK